MSRRPASLPVGAVPFDIEWDAANMPRDNKDDYGETLYPRRLIFINEEKCGSQTDIDRTLLHEGVHASLFVAGLDNVFDSLKTQFGFDLEESVATAIENNLYPYLCALVRLGHFKPTRK